MLRRRDPSQRVAAGFVSRHPRESAGLFVGGSVIVMICANALFMQPGPHPAPIFARTSGASRMIVTGPLSPEPLVAQPRYFEPVNANILPQPRPASATVSAKVAKPLAVQESLRQDPIAQLLSPSKRVIAVQRILTAYGYGQIKPSGAIDSATEDAIRKFESARKLPVTGQLSDQLVRTLSAMSGQQID